MTQANRLGSEARDEAFEELERQNRKLMKINAALMQRVERSMDYQANAYSMFQTAIGLETQVRARTEELKTALDRLERTNDELRAARDGAERANRFKTRFFTAVGHDLLQPLHAARLSLSALSESGVSPYARLIGQVDHSLSTIEELLRTILDLSKLESGAFRPSLQAIALRDLLQSVLLDMAPIAAEKGLVLSMRSPDVTVMSDPLMLRRILQNLLANAVQYTDEGRVLLAARRRGTDMRIDVWDTGPGIALGEQTKIFEEFQRGAAGERSHGGGFGIGLAIISRMIEALGHRIALWSEPGRGTRFSVAVPMAPDGAVADRVLGGNRQEVAERVYGLAATKVVVIDNDIAVRQAMGALLDRWGCDARLVSGLDDINKLITGEPAFTPNIVLADFHLDNGESGLTAVQRLRQARGLDIPAVVITADHSPEVSDEVSGAACEILRKPVKPAELRALITHILS